MAPFGQYDGDDTYLKGGTDGALIGNVGDRMKVDALATVVFGSGSIGNVLRQAEVTNNTKTETDISGTTYTVPTAKTFALTSITANFDTQSPLIVRLKKQTGGTGAFTLVWRVVLKQHGQDPSHVSSTIPLGVIIGTATDVFKLTYESALAKGVLWASYTGVEF